MDYKQRERMYIPESEFPRTAFKLDEHGNRISLLTPDKKVDPAVFWSRNDQKIGLILFVSAGALLLLLLSVADPFSFFWETVVGFIVNSVGAFFFGGA